MGRRQGEQGAVNCRFYSGFSALAAWHVGFFDEFLPVSPSPLAFKMLRALFCYGKGTRTA